MAKIKNVKNKTNSLATFKEIKLWFDQNMAVDKIDLNDKSVFEYSYHDGNFPGIFQATSSGAQRFFKKAKPTSITDVAILTSIYRPGPLAANLDKLYVETIGGKEYDWGDKRINKILEKTYGLLIFQEGVMLLAEKVAGFPKEKCDEIRRAIMKRSISGGEAAKKAAQETRDSFVEGAVKNGYSKSVANNVYDKILYFAGYGFNAAHATAYAIDSYWCSWLLRHHEESWLTAYVESMLGNPENKAEALGYIKQMGYTIIPIDVNYASASWTILPGKKFMPSFLSCKGVGDAAVEEVIEARPFKSLEDMLYNEDGSWRFSKFNKRAFDALIKVGAFASLDCVGEGKLFNNYRHMYEVIVENMDAIKKTSKKDPHLGRKTMFALARELGPMDEWSRKELASFQAEIFGSLDVSTLLEPDVLKRLDEKNIKSIDEWTEKGYYWFSIADVVKKKTKTGKSYLILKGLGPVGVEYKINAWGWNGTKEFSPYAVVIAEVDKNDFGYSTTMWRVKELT